MPDKILVTNFAALQKKYGAQGLKSVRAAISALVTADKARGLSTQLVDVSDAKRMKGFKGSAVTTISSGRQCKDAIDAIYASSRPDYLVILDGPDVVPHLGLNNPTPKDKDPDVPSDLPYASDALFTKRDISHFAAVTRVVGRIPGITGAKKPNFLIKQIETAAQFKPRKRQDYLAGFVISADVWKNSTTLSAENMFSSNAIKTCPKIGTPGVAKLLAPLCHFINCHGAKADPQFYGQKGGDYPVALTSGDVAKGAKRHSIVAAECCYGAELYDPTLNGGQQPIANAYLDAGAIGYLGSTNIAYGPADGNSAADLLTQYFVIKTLEGASLGRACLEARQKFVLGQKMEDPVNLKTLGQFILLGDPSLAICQPATTDSAAEAKSIDHHAARETRRVFLAAAGKSAADSSGFPGKKIARPAKGLEDLVRKIARGRGFQASTKNVDAFHVVGGAEYGQEMKARGVEQKVVVITEQSKFPGKGAAKLPKDMVMTRIFVAHTQDNRVIEVSSYVRR